MLAGFLSGKAKTMEMKDDPRPLGGSGLLPSGNGFEGSGRDLAENYHTGSYDLTMRIGSGPMT